MISYMPSLKWPTMRSETKLLATDAPLSKLPAHEREALAQLRAQTQSDVERAASTLPQEDVWRDLGDSQNATLRDEILLRFLRYNALSTDNAQRQVRSVLEWRAEHGIAAESPQVMYGVDAGIPVTRLSGPTPDGDLLFFCAAEMYSRCDVDHAKQGVALARLFDLLLYDVDGPRAKRGSVVIDFTNMSARNVDLVGLRLGVLLYTSYYPDLFLKILFFNYPKFIYGVWKAICPMLDARTVSRVEWATDGDDLRKHLEPTFPASMLPTWMGGTAPTEDYVTMYTGSKVEASQLVGRFS